MPKILGDSLSDHRELTRGKLFDALCALMAEQSFDSITMSMIAARAAVGRTAIYNHFADKEVLLLEFMNYTTAEFSRVVSARLRETPDPLEQFAIFLRSHLEMTEKYHLAPGLNLRKKISPDNCDRLHHHADTITELLTQILRAAIDAGRLPVQNMNLLVALVQSTLAGHRLPADPEAREATIRTIQAFILRGAGAPAEDIPPVPSHLPQVGGFEGDPKRPGSARPNHSVSETAFLRCPVHH